MDAAVAVPARRGLHRRSGQAKVGPSSTYDATDRPANRGSREAETPRDPQGHASTWGIAPRPTAYLWTTRSEPSGTTRSLRYRSPPASPPRRSGRRPRLVVRGVSSTAREMPTQLPRTTPLRRGRGLTPASEAETSEPGSAARPTATTTRDYAARPRSPGASWALPTLPCPTFTRT